ncbi:glycosyltransferase family 4 protein [Plantibacter sp. CFBP 8798]|uniref:glycosyltransferase n=1 Tax=Plantibacter sp. CFBP 8798 TaxID=2775268 RepID=UPI0017828063|nr:glycosyltransferase family 4 protein [Plantibacter sp. CFBP 8798]
MSDVAGGPRRQRWLVAATEYAGLTSYTGGIGRHYAALLPALVRSGIEVDLIVCSDDELRVGADLDGVRLAEAVRHGSRTPRVLRLLLDARAVRRAFRRGSYDRVFLPEWSALGSALPRSAPLVTNLATSIRLSNLVSGLRLGDLPVAGRIAVIVQDALETRQIRRSAALVAISTAMLARTKDLLGALPPAAVVRNCIDVDAVRVAASTAGLPAQWPTGAEPVVLFLGRLERRKGVVEAFQAFALLVRQKPDARLVLAGSSGDRRFEPDLTALLSILPESVRDRVVWLGHVAGAELYRAVGAATVVMCPSRWEGFGNVALEAKAIGTPLVVTTGSGYDDFCTDGVDCLMVPPGDHGALARALRRVLDAPSDALTRAATARASVDRYAPEPVAAALVAAVDGLLGPVG